MLDVVQDFYDLFLSGSQVQFQFLPHFLDPFEALNIYRFGGFFLFRHCYYSFLRATGHLGNPKLLSVLLKRLTKCQYRLAGPNAAMATIADIRIELRSWTATPTCSAQIRRSKASPNAEADVADGFAAETLF